MAVCLNPFPELTYKVSRGSIERVALVSVIVSSVPSPYGMSSNAGTEQTRGKFTTRNSATTGLIFIVQKTLTVCSLEDQHQ